jgi:hypothetical protein
MVSMRRTSPATSQAGAQGFPATPFQLSGAWSSPRATLLCFWARTAYPRKKRRAVTRIGRREAALRQLDSGHLQTAHAKLMYRLRACLSLIPGIDGYLRRQAAESISDVPAALEPIWPIGTRLGPNGSDYGHLDHHVPPLLTVHRRPNAWGWIASRIVLFEETTVRQEIEHKYLPRASLVDARNVEDDPKRSFKASHSPTTEVLGSASCRLGRLREWHYAAARVHRAYGRECRMAVRCGGAATRANLSLRTTNKYYNRARGIEASRAYRRVITGMRRKRERYAPLS